MGKIRLAVASVPTGMKERYGRFAGAPNTQPSFGLVCLAASAREAGAEVRITEAASANLSEAETIDDILSFRPDVVGFSATTIDIVTAGRLAEKLKEPNPRIITLIGGCHVSAIPQRTLEEFPSFDLAVIGEGEVTIAELIEIWQEDLHVPVSVAGTAVRINGTVHQNDRRPYLSNMDELPLPAWDLVRGFPSAFRVTPSRVRRLPCASVVLTRGCPNRCSFCDRSVFGHRCRAYTPAYAIRMLKDLQVNYGVKELIIQDDTFVVSRTRVEELCDRLIGEKLDLTWSCLGRADRMTPDILRKMRRAGCWHMSYGIESGNQTILAQMQKNLDLKQIERALRWTKEAGIRTKGFFILGFPNETEQTIRQTIDVAKRLALDDISVFLLTPFPGSDLYREVHDYGTFDSDWTKMNVLTPVFVPHGLTKDTLEGSQVRMLREFYLRPSIIADKVVQSCLRPRVAWDMFKVALNALRAQNGRKQ